MRSSRVAILVALVALLVLASPAAAVERSAHHRAHHRHAPTPIVSPHHHSHHRSHEVEEHEAAAPAAAAEEHEEKSYADEREAEFGPGDLGNFQAELMRFAQAQVQDSPVVEAAKANDVFRKMYNVMAGFRDKEAKETSQVQKAVVAEQQKQAELIEQAKALKAKNEALTRLQYCLEKDTSGAAATAAVGNAAAADASAQLQKKQGELDALKKQLDEMKATLDQRTAQLEDREAKIKSREDLLQQHLDKLKMSLAQLEGREVKAAAAEVAAVKALTGAQAQCSAGCAAKLSCGQCTADPKCGWCSTTSTCLDVTKADELSKCPTAADLNVFYCKDETCEQHTGCQSCMSDPRCGFCGTNGKCMNGTLAGPAVGQCFSWNYDDGMRFLSLNIYGRDITNVSSRATAIFKLLEDSQADFIALQEVEDWFLKALDAQPFAAKYYKSDFGSGHAPGGLFILSRLPLDSVAYVEKTAPGQVEVDQRGRMLVVTPRLGRGNLQIATTTLDWRSPEARADNLDFVFSNVNTTQQVVVMGDFNFDHNAQPETSRVPLAFRDLWSEVHPTQPGFTWDPASNSYARLSDPRSRPSRIDRMFVSSGFVDLRRVALVGGSSVSPHFGLLGDVQLFAAYC